MSDLLSKSDKKSGPVECLGKTFANDDARRAHFLSLLDERLKDKHLRKTEGFPIGTDEAILALSDPPYFTACPNPFITDFIKHYGKAYDATVLYSKEPFAADVSEGKNDPIYSAHSYHTKVPHKAIMRYILHYTQPGDLVFDGFCGTGMTGVAAQLCGDRTTVESLGYRVEDNGIISASEQENGRSVWKPFSKLGARWTILNDLSPAATFIAYNYNTPPSVSIFEEEAKKLLADVRAECGWMYHTLHKPTRENIDSAVDKIKNSKNLDVNATGMHGRVNYTVWSDVFVCPECAGEVVFTEAAVDKETGHVSEEFGCPHCSSVLRKRGMEHAWTNIFDETLQEQVKQSKRVPVLISYNVGKVRFEKKPDAADLAIIQREEANAFSQWYPSDRLIEGGETRRNDSTGLTHLHHFYTKRALHTLAVAYEKTRQVRADVRLYLLFVVQQAVLGMAKIAR